jgi:CheY-like chemotaxis protein
MVTDGPSALIMVADDDQGFRGAVRDFLLDEGFRVAEASDGDEAVVLASELAPDVVLMDLRMPGMDGIEAARRIKELSPLVQVVMLTALGDPSLKRGAQEAGVYCYLVKGCPPLMVLDMLRFACAYKLALEGESTISQQEPVA